jgi:hypothetical protein
MNWKKFIKSTLTITLVLLTFSGFAQGHPESWFTEARMERNWRQYQRHGRKIEKERLAKAKKVKRAQVYANKQWGFKATVSVYTADQNIKRHYIQFNSGEALIETSETGVYIDTSAIRKLPILVGQRHTILNISDYTEDSACYVTVYAGNVDILCKGAKMGLQPNQYVVFKRDTFFVDNLMLFDVGVKSDRSWLTGTFDFVNKPLFMIINRAARTNHFKVIYARKPRQRVSGSIFADYHMLSLVGTLHGMFGGFGYSVDEPNKTVTIN